MWGWTVKIDVCDNLSGRKPHVCGDGPLKDMEELVDQIVNPTYVGMDRSCPEYDPEPKRDIPEERGGQRLKYDIDKVMLLTRAGMTEAEICRRMGGMPLDTLRRYKAILRRKGKLC